VSWGKGDPQKDPITLVFLDEAGRLREYTRTDNLNPSDAQEFSRIAITYVFDEVARKYLVPTEKLLTALERVLSTALGSTSTVP
jgi:hypothetical protein